MIPENITQDGEVLEDCEINGVNVGWSSGHLGIYDV